MSFEKGTVSFRFFDFLGEWPDPFFPLFASHAAPALERMGTEPVHGWVGGRHLLDVPLTEENTMLGGYPTLILMRAERKIPPALFKASCMLEEQLVRKAEEKAFLNRRERNEIRARVLERLLPAMPPQLQGIPFVADPAAGMLYAGALSETQLDAFTLEFRRASGLEVIPMGISTLAARRRRVDVRHWAPISFAAGVDDDRVNDSPGQDFLTWLLYRTETGSESFTDPELGTVGCAIEGPLVFSMPEGSGAQEAVLRRGSPVRSAEAGTCLRGGKKLRRARLTLSVGEDAFTASFDADTFVCRGLSVPEEDAPPLDAVSRFQDRMLKLGRFRDALIRLADRFIEARADATAWPETVRLMRRWIAERDGSSE